MKLQVPFIHLPVRFDAETLAAEVAALGEEAWRPHPQGYPGNSALTLITVIRSALNTSGTAADAESRDATPVRASATTGA